MFTIIQGMFTNITRYFWEEKFKAAFDGVDGIACLPCYVCLIILVKVLKVSNKKITMSSQYEQIISKIPDEWNNKMV